MELYEEFLERARAYFPAKHPKNLLTLMGVDHYENQITDLLAFFLFEKEEHGLGKIFLQSLMSSLNLRDPQYSALIKKPKREVSTEDGKRIDLVLEGSSWSMIVENKVRHFQSNPFKSYENFAERNLKKNDQSLHYVILSPSGLSGREGWAGVNYPTFISEVRRRLPRNDVSPTQKWFIFAREFLDHLENITMKYVTKNKNRDFVFNNLSNIKKIKSLQDNVVKIFQEEILNIIAPSMEGRKRVMKSGYWPNGPRWHIQSWNGNCEIVIYFQSVDNNIRLQIRVYFYNILRGADTLEEKQVLAEKHFGPWLSRVELNVVNRIIDIYWTDMDYDEANFFNKLKECIRYTNSFDDLYNKSI